MRITFRLILSLIVAASAVVFISAGYQARHERLRLQEELERRATILGDSFQELIEPLLGTERLGELERFV